MQAAVSLVQVKRIAAQAAHDINNPLAGIKNSFLLIKDAIPPTHPSFPHLGAIEREIGRLAAATRRLAEAFEQGDVSPPAADVPAPPTSVG